MIRNGESKNEVPDKNNLQAVVNTTPYDENNITI